MRSIFLLGGGGNNPDGRMETYGHFFEAASTPQGCRIALLIAEEADAFAEAFEAYAELFRSVGATQPMLAGIPVAPTTPLTKARLIALNPTAIFVCGGLTPRYQEALCVDRSWLEYLSERDIVYGGVSAGAAIAAERAVVGGWQAQRGERIRQILFQGASEGCDLLDTRQGLGLVPYTIDVHASQWGTLTRLIHAVSLGVVGPSWGIDEDTLLEVRSDRYLVHGSGHVYVVRLTSDGTSSVTILTGGDEIRF